VIDQPGVTPMPREEADASIRASCLRTLALALLVVVVLGAVLVLGGRKAHRGQERACVERQQCLLAALNAYAMDHDEYYPPADSDWRAAVLPILEPRAEVRAGVASRFLTCPGLRSTVFYERNSALANVALDRLPADLAPTTIVTWESADGVGVSYPHPGGTVYGFADGHAASYARGADEGLIWSPERLQERPAPGAGR
jgi:prepilin-type processing-associated H-X9-DG protein